MIFKYSRLVNHRFTGIMISKNPHVSKTCVSNIETPLKIEYTRVLTDQTMVFI